MVEPSNDWIPSLKLAFHSEIKMMPFQEDAKSLQVAMKVFVNPIFFKEFSLYRLLNYCCFRTSKKNSMICLSYS